MHHFFTIKWPLFVISFLSFFLIACNETGSSSEIGNTGINNTSGQISELDLALAEVLAFNILPAMDNFNTQAKKLNSSILEYCPVSDNKMTEQGLAELQSQWKELNNAWFNTLPFLFGPLETPADELGLTPTYAYIDSFRSDHINRSSSIRSRITTSINDSNFDESAINSYSYQKTGLLPLEILLFERSSDQDTTTSVIVNEYLQTNKCSLLRGHSNVISNLSKNIVNGWKNNYRATGVGYAELFINNSLDYYFTDSIDGSGLISTTRFITALQNHFEYLENRNIHTNTALLAESYWEAISASVGSAEAALSGTEDTNLSIYSFISITGNNDNMDRIKSSLTSIMTTIEEQNVGAMQTAAGTVRTTIGTDLTSALNVSLGLNFSDGD